MSMSKDERKFLDVVQSIKGAEDDVDKVLKAARLLRHEGADNRLTASQKADIIGNVILLIGMICGFVFLYLLLTSAAR